LVTKPIWLEPSAGLDVEWPLTGPKLIGPWPAIQAMMPRPKSGRIGLIKIKKRPVRASQARAWSKDESDD
jgi:hypothetical protein